jgi:hypothetical protein
LFSLGMACFLIGIVFWAYLAQNGMLSPDAEAGYTYRVSYHNRTVYVGAMQYFLFVSSFLFAGVFWVVSVVLQTKSESVR